MAILETIQVSKPSAVAITPQRHLLDEHEQILHGVSTFAQPGFIRTLEHGQWNDVTKTPGITFNICPPEQHPTTIIAQLNDQWRVIDEPVQWILQYRNGRGTQKSTGWRGRRYHCDRDQLVVSVRELAGPIDADELQILMQLPKWHPDPRSSLKPSALERIRAVH